MHGHELQLETKQHAIAEVDDVRCTGNRRRITRSHRARMEHSGWEHKNGTLRCMRAANDYKHCPKIICGCSSRACGSPQALIGFWARTVHPSLPEERR